jgi:hypothetical protein
MPLACAARKDGQTVMERTRHSRARRAWPLLSIAAIACAAEAATARTRTAAPATSFACAGGIAFTVAYVRGGAWVTTRAGRWLLRRAPSGIGKRYVSPDAAFILDQDRAALVGLPGGPFLRCTAAAPGPVRQRLAGLS